MNAWPKASAEKGHARWRMGPFLPFNNPESIEQAMVREGRRGAGTTDDTNVKHNRGESHRDKIPPRTKRNYKRHSM